MAALLIAPVVASPVAQDTATTDGLPWWNNRVFYEVFVRAFQDSDGDGNGDLPGLISKLDYLNDGDPNTDTDLGVTGLWLMPVMQSTSYHGYDITDYEQIETDFGTNDDFKRLVAEAHKRGIAVIIDMVLNHTSSEHPWFIDAQTPGSTHDSWYIWSDKNPGYSGPWGESVWHKNGNRFFYGVFWEGQPDLNLNNPDVTAALYGITDFWLNDMGVDGFRLDAVKHLIEEGQIQEDTPETLQWLGQWNDHVESVKPDAFTVGEVSGSDSSILAEYAPSRVDTVFEFSLASAMLQAIQYRKAVKVSDVQQEVLNLYPPGQYAAFLTNHDQQRVMNLLRSPDRAKVAASLLLTQPGVPFLYYGEEIGMIGSTPDECLRIPFQWDDTHREAPFMLGKGCKSNEDEYNLAAEQSDPNSLFSHYRILVHLRNDHPALRLGDFTLVNSEFGKCLQFPSPESRRKLVGHHQPVG